LKSDSPLTLLFVSAFLMDICVLTVRTTIPLLAHSLGASPFVVGLIAGTMSLVYTSSALGLGRLSDTLGRTRLVLASFLVFAAGALLLAVSSFVWQLFAFVSLVGLGMAMFWPIVEAWIADLEVRQPLQAIRRFCIAWSSGTMVGPVLAGILLGSVMAFGRAMLGVAVISVASLISLLWRRRWASNPEGTQRESVAEPVPNWIFYAALVALFSCWTVQTTSYTFFPLIASSSGIPAALMGAMLFFIGSARTVVFILLPQPLGLRRTFRLLSLAVIMGLLGSFIFLLSASHIAYVIALALFGSSVGVVYVTILRLAVIGLEGRGFRTGLFESVIGISALVSPLGSGVFANIKLTWAYVFNFGTLLLSLIVLETIHLKNRKRIQEIDKTRPSRVGRSP